VTLCGTRILRILRILKKNEKLCFQGADIDEEYIGNSPIMKFSVMIPISSVI